MLSAAGVTAEILDLPAGTYAKAGVSRPVIQLGYTVPDIEQAAAAWAAAAGAGPFFRIGRGPLALVNARHRGAPAEWSHSTSAGWSGRVMIELTEQHSASPESLATEMGIGRHGLNHVTWLVDDLDDETRRLEALGIPLIIAATAGPQEFRFHDATRQLGHRIEFYLPIPAVLGMYRAVQAASRGWDGRDPVRPLSALRPFLEHANPGPSREDETR
jgi:hypothetical protein